MPIMRLTMPESMPFRNARLSPWLSVGLSCCLALGGTASPYSYSKPESFNAVWATSHKGALRRPSPTSS